MIWIDAVPGLAQVVYNQSLWYRTNHQFVHRTVRHYLAAFDPHPPIPRRHGIASPDPAPMVIDHEPLESRRAQFRHLLATALAVGALPALAGSGLRSLAVTGVDGRRNLHRCPFLAERLMPRCLDGLEDPEWILVMMSLKEEDLAISSRPRQSRCPATRTGR